MRELRKYAEPALRIACLILAGLVIYELAGIAHRWNPFRGASVPELPALSAATNAPPGVAAGNNMTVTMGTNGPTHSPTTNLPYMAATANTNQPSPPMPSGVHTNIAVVSTTNTMGSLKAVKPAGEATNAATNLIAKIEARPADTNVIGKMVSTNGGSNLLASATGTNTTKKPKKNSNASAMPDMAGMPFSPFGPSGKHGADLPPAVQARISKITDSEILGPVMRPLPMALLGIAGEVAFLRSDSGQTGLVKPGDTLDDIKLLRIGVNRVLIEQNGQKKELTIFSGYGSDSLMQNNSTNENKQL